MVAQGKDKTKTEDLINSICAGNGERFGGVFCGYYLKASEKRECSLLVDNKTGEMWVVCRCDFFNKIIKKMILRIKPETQHSDVEDILQNVIKKALKINLRVRNLAGWISNLRRTAYTTTLDELGFVKKECGSCNYLSERESCHLEWITSEEPNPHHGQKMNLTNPHCNGYTRKEIFQDPPLNGGEIGVGPTPPEKPIDIFIQIIDFSKSRIDQAEGHSRLRYIRQLAVFEQLMESIEIYDDFGKAKRATQKILSEKFLITRETISDDIDEIFEEIKGNKNIFSAFMEYFQSF